MKDFKNRGFRIAESSKEVKLAYTGYLVFAFVGYLTLILISLLRVGPGYQNIVEHYRGSGNEDAFPRAFGQMLEEVHFHAFIEGVTLLVLTHLFIATSVRKSVKVGTILAAYGATLTDLASPWLVRYIAPGFAWVQISSWIAMTATALALIGIPLYEMWLMKADK
jgi:hypothetical protein